MIDTPLPFRGRPPSRGTWVLPQTTIFERKAWISRLPNPDWWPPELDSQPALHGRAYVDRETVFEVAARAYDDLQGAAHTWVATTVWGTGLKQVARLSKPMRHDGALERLTEALVLLRDQGPIAAYTRLHPSVGAAGLIRDLGPSFGTKVLYFAGYESARHDLKPLILDRRVANALTNLSAGTWDAWGWSPRKYEDYLRLAARWADNWRTTPDVVERVLFSIGHSERLALKVLTGRR